MKSSSVVFWPVIALLLPRGGCATRPVNPPIKDVDASAAYTGQSQ